MTTLPPLHGLSLVSAVTPILPVSAPDPDEEEEPLYVSVRPANRLEDPPPWATELQTEGFCVIPFLDAATLGLSQARFIDTLENFPEYLPNVSPHDPSQHYVQGGFGALGNPSSFHNPFVRDMRRRAQVLVLRQRVFSAMLSVVAEQSAGENNDYREVRLEQCIDRMLFRRTSKAPTAETWHRDEAVGCMPGDEVFGGWVNLGSQFQYLNAVRRTHLGQQGNDGFAKVSKDEAEWATRHREAIPIPPGHLLVFNEKLMHEVRGGKLPHDVMRLFFGWRLTLSSEALGGSDVLTHGLQTQAVMRLKSGQTPKMYAQMSWSQPGQRIALSNWSVTTFRPECLEMRQVLSHPGESHRMVIQHMPSLLALGYATYDPYEMWEARLLWPNRGWTLPDGAGGNETLILS